MSISSSDDTFISQIDYILELTGGLCCSNITIEDTNTEIEITPYNSDSGDRDLYSEKSYDSETPFRVVLSEAVKLKALLIVKCNYINEQKKGKWYIKGYKKRNQYTYNEVKERIEDNLLNGLYSKRFCFLIEYDIEN